MSRALIFRFEAWMGWDSWRGIMPHVAQAKRVARSLMRPCHMLCVPLDRVLQRAIHDARCRKGQWFGIDPKTADARLIVQMPFGAFRIIDIYGNVERCRREDMGGAI